MCLPKIQYLIVQVNNGHFSQKINSPSQKSPWNDIQARNPKIHVLLRGFSQSGLTTTCLMIWTNISELVMPLWKMAIKWPTISLNKRLSICMMVQAFLNDQRTGLSPIENHCSWSFVKSFCLQNCWQNQFSQAERYVWEGTIKCITNDGFDCLPMHLESKRSFTHCFMEPILLHRSTELSLLVPEISVNGQGYSSKIYSSMNDG